MNISGIGLRCFALSAAMILLAGCAGFMPPADQAVAQTYQQVSITPLAGTTDSQTHSGVSVDVQVVPIQPIYVETTEYDGSFFSDVAASVSGSVAQGKSGVSIATYDETFTPLYYSPTTAQGPYAPYLPFAKIHFKVTVKNETNDAIDLNSAFAAVKLNGTAPAMYPDGACEVRRTESGFVALVGPLTGIDCRNGTDFEGTIASGRISSVKIAPGETMTVTLAGPQIQDLLAEGRGRGTLQFAIYDVASSWAHGRVATPFVWNYNYGMNQAPADLKPVVKKAQMTDEDAKALNGKVVTHIDN